MIRDQWAMPCRRRARARAAAARIGREVTIEHRCSRSLRERSSACPCRGGTLHKLGEDVTETLELIPRQWKVIQHVREKLSCRSCEQITQPPAPSHPIARGRAGPGLWPAGPERPLIDKSVLA